MLLSTDAMQLLEMQARPLSPEFATCNSLLVPRVSACMAQGRNNIYLRALFACLPRPPRCCPDAMARFELLVLFELLCCSWRARSLTLTAGCVCRVARNFKSATPRPEPKPRTQ